MTAKEKCDELVKRFYKKNCEILEKDGTTPFEEIEQEIAKQCSLIAVEEITQYLTKVDHDYNISEYINYWNDVKTEINAL